LFFKKTEAMSGLIEELRTQFISRHGAAAKLVVINVGLYLAFGLISVTLFLSGKKAAFDSIITYFTLPSDIHSLLYRPWTMFTYMFVHHPTAVFHILFNMLWLYWMGRILREFAGDNVTWAAYLYGGLAGGIFYVAAFNVFPGLSGFNGRLLGASAGVNGVLMAAAALVPNYPIHLFLFGAVRLKWLAAILLLMDLVLISGANPGGMIAHLGGAAMGFVLIVLRRHGVDLTGVFDFFRRSSPHSTRSYRNPRMRVVHPPPPKPTPQEIDRILDKIQAVGYQNLTKEEKQTLFRASQE
jgi:membrane associated rhomboid family serine protease